MAALSTLLSTLATTGCDEPAPKARPSTRDASAWVDAEPAMDLGAGGSADRGLVGPTGDASRRDAGADDSGPTGPRPSWIEVELTPRQPLYGLGDTPRTRAFAYDAQGAPMGDVPLTWRVAPPGIATLSEEGTLAFEGEGQGAVVACFGEAPCGRAAFFVDAGPPTLIIGSPERGAILGGEGFGTIAVRGTAVDTGGSVEVRVNGERVEVGADGKFSLDVTARFGINRIEVTADDGVQRNPVRDRRDVLWAPSYLPTDPLGVSVRNALILRLDQAQLDLDSPVVFPDGAAELVLDELAQVIELLILAADLESALGDPVFADSPAFSLRVTGVSLGTPEVDLFFSQSGMELFVYVPSARVETAGHLEVEGERISLNGAIVAGLAAFARLEVVADEDGLRVELEDVGVAVERVSGEYASALAGVLINTLGSRLRAVATELAEELVVGLIADQLPAVLEAGLGSLVGALDHIPIDLAIGFEGAPRIALDLSLTPSASKASRRSLLRVDLDGRISQRLPVASPHPSPGVPALAPDDEALVAGEGIGLLVRLELVNALLYEVWRTRLLQISPPLPAQLTAVLGQVVLDGRLPPVVVPAAPGAEYPLEAQIGDLRLIAQSPRSPEPDVYTLAVRAGLWVRTVDSSFEFVVSDEPYLDAVLISQGGARPLLSPDALALLVRGVVWPMVQEALDGGMRFAIDPVAVDPRALATLAPRISSVRLTPQFNRAARVNQGRVRLEGGMTVEVGLDGR